MLENTSVLILGAICWNCANAAEGEMLAEGGLGAWSSKPHGNIREKVQKLYPTIVANKPLLANFRIQVSPPFVS